MIPSDITDEPSPDRHHQTDTDADTSDVVSKNERDVKDEDSYDRNSDLLAKDTTMIPSDITDEPSPDRHPQTDADADTSDVVSKNERDVKDEDSYARNSDLHALKERLEKMEVSQRLEIEEHKREVESQKREIETQKLQIQELEATQEEMKAFLPVDIPLGNAGAGAGATGSDVEGVPQRPNRASLASLRQSQAQAQGQSRRHTFTYFRTYQLLLGEGNFETLEHDTFTMMMLSKVWSRSWLLGFASFLFQIVLGVLIALNQNNQSIDSSKFDVPFKVDSVVRTGQFLAIVICLFTQSDIITSVKSLILLGKGSNWDQIIGESGNKSACLWITRILFPNLLKFSQGILVMFVSFVIIVQTDDIIELLKDFTALMVLSETDNIVFYIASNGYLGRELLNRALDTKNAMIDTSHTTSFGGEAHGLLPDAPAATRTRGSTIRKILLGSFFFRPFILLALFAPMIGGSIYIMRNQLNGVYFRQKYPKCNFPGAFKLALEHFGDDTCYGGPLNTLDCDFEGGDCVLFNLAYPLCKGRDDLVNVQEKMDNGVCDMFFAIPECDYDGGDCCPYNIINSETFGDGQCHAGISSTGGCGYDKGDCNTFHRLYPDCPYTQLEELRKVEILGDVVIGDGVCNSGIYNTQDCGWENGDCDIGQIGQDFRVDGANDAFPVSVTTISRDGSTLAVGSGGLFSTGFVDVYKYDESRKFWMARGETMTGERESDYGSAISLTDTGNRMAIAAPNADNGLGKVWVLDYVPSEDSWVQIGQTFRGSGDMTWTGQRVELTGDGSRLAIAAPSKDVGMYMMTGQISVYELNIAQKIWNPLGNAINGTGLFTVIGYETLHLNSDDGNIVVFSSRESFGKNGNIAKVYKYDLYVQDWIKLGDDIQTPNPGDSVISSDGGRIAFAINTTRFDAAGYFQAFEFDKEASLWEQVGSSIYKSIDSSEGDGFGYRMAMSRDGQLLSISSVNPDCDGFPSLCATGQVEFYLFDPSENDFMGVYGKYWDENVAPIREKEIEHSIFGNGLSLSGDGSIMAIGGYNLQDDHGFIRVYQVNDLFYPRCTAKEVKKLKDNECQDEFPYNSDLCEFDGGKCLLEPVENLPGCFVSHPEYVGDGECEEKNLQMYNTSECEFDGGDCL